MDAGDSLLLLAASYNVGVTKMIRLLSEFCSGSTQLKDCLDRMKIGALKAAKQGRNITRDIHAFTTYVMRIRNCTQRFSAEQIDFDDDLDWSEKLRIEKKNQQRGHVVSCMLHPCPFREPASNAAPENTHPKAKKK